jgi:hypothetical protein
MKINLQKICLGVIIALLVLYTIQNGLVIFKQLFRNMRYIASHPTDSYDDKMRIYWWTVYDYLQFVKQNTPPTATIVIPPQQRPFLTSGNAGIVEYFLYPRKIITGSLSNLPAQHYDFVMIVHGEWPDAPVQDYDFPKIPVSATEVVYFDQQTKKSVALTKDFDPKDPLNVGVSGLIQVNKASLQAKGGN